MKKDWLFVALTCLFELLWIYGFNVASTWWHWAIICVCIITDFYFLAKACENLPTGTVYAIFAGIGTMGTALMDIFIFNTDFSYKKALFITIIVIGVISLTLADNHQLKKKA